MNGGKKIASILFVCAAIYIENKEQLCLSQRTKAMHVTYTNQMQHQSHIKSQDDYERGVKMAEDRIPSTQWRRYGIERRKELVYKDEQKGGTSFVVNPECPIQRYFSLSQRVSDSDLKNRNTVDTGYPKLTLDTYIYICRSHSE